MATAMNTTRRYSATEKAALTLLTLGREIASDVLKNLSEAEVKRISRAFMLVNEVPREDQFSIGKEFHTMMKAGETMLVDGREFARDVISSAFGDAGGETLLEYISGSRKDSISSIIRDVPDKILISFVSAEHPQTVAFLLTRMNPDQAAMVLQTMS
ncbi:MAG: hypothetical protein ACO3XO_02160 [Bdellovibrionota bacterium]